MASDANPPRRGRLRQLVAMASVLLIGLVLGVLADRLYLEITKRTPDPRLIGDWVAEGDAASTEENVYRFREDGGYDSTLFAKTDGKVTQKWHYAHQYRWVNRDAIEMYDPYWGWTTRKLVLEGDQVTLLFDGYVLRLKRKSG